MSEEEKKAIEVMKSIEFDIYEWWYDGKRIDIEIDSDIANKSLQTVLNLIEKQNNRLEQLEKENKNLDKLAKTMMNNCTKALEDTVKHDYIPKSAIMEKVEELENYIQENSDEQGYWGSKSADEIYNKIDILKELLGEE